MRHRLRHPFRQDLSLDESALRKLIRRQVDAGIDYLVPCCTAEHVRVVAITVLLHRERRDVYAA